MGVYKWSTTTDPYAGLGVSVVSSNTLFTGDASMVVFSLTTSSATASRWTMLGHMGDGYFAVLDSTQWQSVNAVTAQGIYSSATIPRWVQFQRTPSASSTSILLTVSVGP